MSKTRYFQWIDGEERGSVAILKDVTYEDGEYFYNFADGESCNADFVSQMTNSPVGLKNKFMVEVYSPSDVWNFETIDTKTVDMGNGEYAQAPPLDDVLQASGQSCELSQSGLGKTKLVPPKYKGPFPSLPSMEDFAPKDVITESPVATVEKPTVIEEVPVGHTVIVDKNINKKVVDTTDPVYVLVKNSKKHNTSIGLHIDISLPAKSIFKIASSEFEFGAGKFIDYVIDGLEVDSIIESIKSALLESYSSDDEE